MNVNGASKPVIAEFGGRLLFEERGVVVLYGLGVLADLLPLYLVVVGIAIMHPDDVCGQRHGV